MQHLKDKKEPKEFMTNINADWVKTNQKKETKAYAFVLKLYIIELLD